jgi:hypothetical protein
MLTAGGVTVDGVNGDRRRNIIEGMCGGGNDINIAGGEDCTAANLADWV